MYYKDLKVYRSLDIIKFMSYWSNIMEQNPILAEIIRKNDELAIIFK